MNQLRDLSTHFIADRHNLMAYIYALVREANLTDDIFQEVWLQMAKAVEQGVEIEKPDAWCRGVARNLALQHWRTQKNERLVVSTELVEQVDKAFAEMDENGDDLALHRRAIRKCVEELPALSKRVLRMKYVTGMELQEISESIHKTVAAVKMMLMRIRRALEKCARQRLQEASS